jgi:hypothetical protein
MSFAIMAIIRMNKLLFDHSLKGVIHSHLNAALHEHGGEMAVGNSRWR